MMTKRLLDGDVIFWNRVGRGRDIAIHGSKRFSCFCRSRTNRFASEKDDGVPARTPFACGNGFSPATSDGATFLIAVSETLAKIKEHIHKTRGQQCRQSNGEY
jgi:hypothetical protein